MGETLIRTAIQTQLKGAQHGFGFRRRTNPQQTEMVDGKVHQHCSYWLQTVGSVWDFAHCSAMDP